MADTFEKQINKAIDEVLKDYKNNMVQAVDYAFGQAGDDIWKHSMSILEEYYEEYDPSSYDRTDNLWRAILPYYTTLQRQETKDKVVIKGSVGVEYDPSKLEQLYTTYSKSRQEKGYGESWENGGQVEEEWILNNYLEGIHPDGGWDGAGYRAPANLTPTAKMKTFLKDYTKTFDSNVLTYLLSAVGNKIK